METSLYEGLLELLYIPGQRLSLLALLCLLLLKPHLLQSLLPFFSERLDIHAIEAAVVRVILLVIVGNVHQSIVLLLGHLLVKLAVKIPNSFHIMPNFLLS